MITLVVGFFLCETTEESDCRPWLKFEKKKYATLRKNLKSNVDDIQEK